MTRHWLARVIIVSLFFTVGTCFFVSSIAAGGSGEAAGPQPPSVSTRG